MIIVDTDTLQKVRTCIRSILRLLDFDPSNLKTTYQIQTHEQRNKINSINQKDSRFNDEDSIFQSSIWISSRLCWVCLQTRSRNDEEKSNEEDLMIRKSIKLSSFKQKQKHLIGRGRWMKTKYQDRSTHSPVDPSSPPSRSPSGGLWGRSRSDFWIGSRGEVDRYPNSRS